MHTLQKLSITTIGLAAVFASAVIPAHAQGMQQQRQSFSSETSFTSSCEGSSCGGKQEFKSTTSINQEQRQGSGTGMKGWSNWSDWDNTGWDNWEDETNTNGEVRLTWSMKDGTCHIQYRKVGQAGWPYSTAADCNNGEVTIGGLEEGKNYQFRIKKNDGKWSRPMTKRAQ